MRKNDVARMLAVCARFDGRDPDALAVESWFTLLRDIDVDVVMDAVYDHYRTSPKWLMPYNVVSHAGAVAAERELDVARRSPDVCPACHVNATLLAPGFAVYTHLADCRLKGMGATFHQAVPSGNEWTPATPAGWYLADERQIRAIHGVDGPESIAG